MLSKTRATNPDFQVLKRRLQAEKANLFYRRVVKIIRRFPFFF